MVKVPTLQPSPVPSPQPTALPTPQPTAVPTVQPTAVPTLQPSPVRGHPTAVLNIVRRPPKNVAMLSLLSLSFDLPGPDTSKETEIRLHIWACWGGLLTVLNSAGFAYVGSNPTRPN